MSKVKKADCVTMVKFTTTKTSHRRFANSPIQRLVWSSTELQITSLPMMIFSDQSWVHNTFNSMHTNNDLPCVYSFHSNFSYDYHKLLVITSKVLSPRLLLLMACNTERTPSSLLQLFTVPHIEPHSHKALFNTHRRHLLSNPYAPAHTYSTIHFH